MDSNCLARTTLKYWRYIALALLVTIWILSLIPLDGTSLPGGDKLHHTLAYAALMFAWSCAVMHEADRLKLAIGFCLMGLLIEGFQHLTPYRFFEWGDALANALGVLAGWFAGHLFVRITDRRCRKSPR